MILADFLNEDARADIRQNQLAKRLISLACTYFREDHRATNWHAQRLVKDGETHLIFEGHTLGWPEPYANVYLFLSPPHPERGGMQGKTQSGIPYVQIYGFEDTNDTAVTLGDLITSPARKETLLHELIHLIDRGRNPAMTKHTDKEAYYNSPHEYNAYFHQVAANLMNFINVADQPGLSVAQKNQVAARLNIFPDFQQTLAHILTAGEKSATIRPFLNYLNDKSNRKVLKRLYALHKEAITLLVK